MKTLDDVIHRGGMFTDQWLAANDYPKRYSWAIVLKASGDVIGRMFAMNPDDLLKQIEVTYELVSSWWGQGLCNKGIYDMVNYAILADDFLNKTEV